jgi:hypothetical protein
MMMVALLKIGRVLTSLVLGLPISVGAVWACDPAVYDFSESGLPTTTLEVKPDCSFDDLDYYSFDNSAFDVDELTGRPVRNIGNGRVAQRLSVPACGATTEYIFFMDCTSSETVVIMGIEDPSLVRPDGYYVPEILVEYIQSPYGAISLKPGSKAPALLEAASKNGYSASTNVSAFVATGLLLGEGEAQPDPAGDYRSQADAYDFTCGCKLYYPGSAGAGG